MKAVRTILVILLIIGLGAGAFYIYQRYQKNQVAQANQLQTVALTRGPLTATVGATGTVRANQTTVLTWQTSGTVGKVNVKIGDIVRSGDALSEITRQTLAQNIILAEADLINARRSLEQLKTSQTAKAQAQLTLVNAQKAFDDASKSRSNLDRGRGSAEKIASARAQYYLAEDEVKRFQGIYDTFSGREETDSQRALALTNLEAAKTRRDKALVNLNWYLGKASATDITESDAKVAVAQAQLDDAQREWDRLKDGPDPDDITAAEVRIAALEATLNMQRLTAPFAATVTDVKIKPGDQAAPTAQAFRLDDLSRLLVDVQLSEVDINAIKVDQPVTLTFDAIADKTYNGKVIQVGQVGVATQGTVNFTITIELTDADTEVRPGMTAAVNIVVQQLNDVLLVPNRAIRLRDGQRVVYLSKPDGSLEVVNIVLGATSDTNSQVISDQLKEGDQIVLNPPTDLFSSGGMGPGMFRR